MRRRSCVVVEDIALDPKWTALRKIAATEGFRSLFSIPLVRQDNTALGAIVTYFDCPHSPDQTETEMVELYANHAIIAIENARLHEETKRRTQQVLALSEIAASLTSILDLDDVLKMIVRKAVELLDVMACSVYLLDESDTELVMVEAYGLSEEYKSTARVKVGTGVSGRAVAKRQPLQTYDAWHDRRLGRFRVGARREGYRSLLSAPLVCREKILGTLNVYSSTPRRFLSDEVQLTAIFASQSAIAIENARLYAEQQQRLKLSELAMYTSFEKLCAEQQRFQAVFQHSSEELAILYRLSQAVTSAMDVRDILELILSELAKALVFSVAAVLLYDEEKDHLALVASRNLIPDQAALSIARGEGLIGRLAERGEPVLVSDSDRDPVFKYLFKGVYVGSAVCVPLKVGDEILGLFIIANYRPKAYSGTDLSFLATLGNQVAVAIVNANHVKRIEHFAILEERTRIARDMHDGLAQTLGYLNVQTELLEELLASHDIHQASAELVNIRKAVQESNRNIREAIQGLRFQPAAPPDLNCWLRARAQDFSDRTGIRTVVDTTEERIVVQAETQGHILRILEEALSNVRKHARAENVRIGVRKHPGSLTLIVEDDGCGFNPSRIQTEKQASFGLSVMKERAQQRRGEVRVSSLPGGGTRIVLMVPLTGKRREAQ